MVVSLHEQVKNLYENELYSNTIILASMATTIRNNVPAEFENLQEIYQLYCYHGDSLYQTRQYFKAESIFKRALQVRKSWVKPTRTGKFTDSNKDIHSDIDIKLKMHFCYKHLKQLTNAIDILQGIPAKQRTAKINMSLGEIYEACGNIRPAIAAYREVLRSCPLSLEAAERLLALSVKPAEVLSLMADGTSNTEGSALITTWINSRALAYNKEYGLAARSMRVLDSPSSPLFQWPHLLVCLGEVLYFGGDYKQAIYAFSRAHATDTTMQRGLGAYAACLAKDNRLKEHAERLLPSNSILPISQYTAEEWLVLAHIQADRRQLPRAAFFTQKACLVEPKNSEGLLLKGHILLGMKKYPEALRHFREALQLAPGRYEVYSGLAETHLLLRRPRDAVAVASSACKVLSNCCRALTLFANILIKDRSPTSVQKAKSLLERALGQDEKYLPAALALAKLLETDEEPESSIELLERQVILSPSAALHQALGEAWIKRSATENSYADKALHHFSAALALEPNNRKALEAVAKLDRGPPPNQATNSQSAGDEDTTYDIGGDGNIPSDQSVAPEESETDALWSDMELDVNE